MKLLIFDAGPFISLTLNGEINILKKLKEKFPQVTFVITPQVKREAIEKPLTVKRYALEAIKIQNLLDLGILKLSSEFLPNATLEKEMQKFLRLSNSTFSAEGENLPLIQEGEASCLAFSNLCGLENLIVTDERAIRLFTESPENLRRISEKRLHMAVSINPRNLKDFQSFRFIRSTELALLAYENNLFEYKKDKILLDALLYSLKYAGTAITSAEIEEMKSLV